MPTDSGDQSRQARALQVAVAEVLAGLPDEALAELPGEDRAAAHDGVDYRWLSVGMRLGLERPEQARRLLGMIVDEPG